VSSSLWEGVRLEGGWFGGGLFEGLGERGGMSRGKFG